MAHIRLIELPSLKDLVAYLLTMPSRLGFRGRNLRSWFGVSTSSRAAGPQRARLFVESLERRDVPSTFMVNVLTDTHAVNQISGMDSTSHISLRSAIEAADHLGGNQTIQFDAILFAAPQAIALADGMLDLKDTTGDIAIQGPTAGVTINGNHASRVFVVESGTQADLTGLTIINGAVYGNGAGIFNAGTLTIRDSVISGNSANGPDWSNDVYDTELGGGIFNQGALTINNSTIAGNTAFAGAGICNGFPGYAPGTLALTDCTISGNTASGMGGGIANGGTAVLTNDTLSANTTGAYGGAIWETAQLTLQGSIITGNTAGQGGGVYISDSTTTFSNTTVSGNAAQWDEGDGGGVYASNGMVLFDSSIITGNTAAWVGGGIESIQATVTLRNSTISGNAGVYGGGGIDNSGTLVLVNCTIANNSTAQGVGGGISTALYVDAPNTEDPVLINCTISGNVAGVSGGGIFVDATDVVNLYNCTIAGNTAPTGSGVMNYGTLTLNNSIVAANDSLSGGGDLVGYVSSPSVNNLVGNGTGVSGIGDNINGNRVGTYSTPISPLLAPLGSYGGPTQTMALLPGSPAIDAGSNAAIPAGVVSDQRGLARVVKGTVDIGAFESVPVNQAPAITTAANAAFVVAQKGSFIINTSGFPLAAFSESGTLPPGVTFTDHGNGTATARQLSKEPRPKAPPTKRRTGSRSRPATAWGPLPRRHSC